MCIVPSLDYPSMMNYIVCVCDELSLGQLPVK